MLKLLNDKKQYYLHSSQLQYAYYLQYTYNFFIIYFCLFRYIVFTIKSHNNKDDKQATWKNSHVSNAIKHKVQQLYGDVGIAAIRDGFDGNLMLFIMIVF